MKCLVKKLNHFQKYVNLTKIARRQWKHYILTHQEFLAKACFYLRKYQIKEIMIKNRFKTLDKISLKQVYVKAKSLCHTTWCKSTVPTFILYSKDSECNFLLRQTFKLVFNWSKYYKRFIKLVSLITTWN